MFSDKQKQSWQNIKAPDGLFGRIENAIDEPSAKPKTFKRIAFPLIAASLMFVFVAVFIMGRSSKVDVYVNDTLLEHSSQTITLPIEPVTLSRSIAPINSLTFTVDVDSDTVVKTENGEFSVFSEDGFAVFSGNEYTLTEKTIIRWNHPLSDGTYELSLISGIHESIVVVEYDAVNAQQTIKCLKN